MTITEDLIDRLSSETGRRLSECARQGRRRALAKISRYCVSVTTDGLTTKEEYFETAPTIGQIAAHVGNDAFVVSIAMKRRTVRERIRLALAAE